MKGEVWTPLFAKSIPTEIKTHDIWATQNSEIRPFHGNQRYISLSPWLGPIYEKVEEIITILEGESKSMTCSFIWTGNSLHLIQYFFT